MIEALYHLHEESRTDLDLGEEVNLNLNSQTSEGEGERLDGGEGGEERGGR